MPEMPRDTWPDSSLALLLDPYLFISKRARQFQSDVFETRLMLRPTICMTGRAAAELFYDESRFNRRGVAPGWLRKTLFGEGGVQGLDGSAHLHRKEMFMSLMTRDRVRHLAEISAACWRDYAGRWTGRREVVLYDEVNEILTRAVCSWAGVPLAETEVARRTAELKAMFDRAATLRPTHLWSRLARRRAEAWLADIIDDIRSGRLHPPADSAVTIIAWHRDLQGRLLDRSTAAVELINVLRPTVAISVFITQLAVALHDYPECQQRLASGDDGYVDLFVQEVRRFYPFFPLVAARVRRDFDWQGYHFPAGRMTLLDLYGTNHDPRIWQEPGSFRPERFSAWDGNPFGFIPQGGGDYHRNHRCPGEGVAIALMKVAADVLSRRISYHVPAQDLRIERARLPALPRSRVVITDVKDHH